MTTYEEILQKYTDKTNQVASQYGISAEQLANTPVTELESLYGKDVAAAFGQGSSVSGVVITDEMKNSELRTCPDGSRRASYIPCDPAPSQTTPDTEENNGTGGIELETDAPETDPPETDAPKNFFTRTDLIDSVPNWVFMVIVLLCSFFMSMILVLVAAK
jgi:hypothetical protein